jgi:hypothetical protein
MFGCKQNLPADLKSFGDIGVVKTKENTQGILKNRGAHYMFGYSVNHANDE